MIFSILKGVVSVIQDWWTLLGTLLALYAISMFGMFIFELDLFWDLNILQTLWNFTWWFIVTISTVGYGDISPTTTYGQVIAVIDIIFGIGIMTAIIGKGVSDFLERRDRKIMGEDTYEKTKNHIVILGGGKKEKLLSIEREIRSDGINEKTTIILVSDAYERNPLKTANHGFIKGKINSQECIRRSGLPCAKNIIIYGYTDEETILATISANDLNSGEIVVYLRDRNNYTFIDQLNRGRVLKGFPNISIVGRCTDLLLAQEISDYGIVEVHDQLISNGGSTFYNTIYIGYDTSLEKVRRRVRDALKGTLVAIRREIKNTLIINPSNETIIYHGDIIYMIAENRPPEEFR